MCYDAWEKEKSWKQHSQFTVLLSHSGQSTLTSGLIAGRVEIFQSAHLLSRSRGEEAQGKTQDTLQRLRVSSGWEHLCGLPEELEVLTGERPVCLPHNVDPSIMDGWI